MRPASSRAPFARLLIALGSAYASGIFGWAVCRALLGDRWWWLFALNAFAPFLLLPLPVVAVVGLALRSRTLLLATVGVLVVGGVVIGPSFPLDWPKARAEGPALTILTFNVFGHSDCPACAVATIRAANADLVAIQELTPAIADALARDLAEAYPYQVLAPDPGVVGMGTISRYPLRATGEALLGSWFATPQLLALDYGDTTVAVINAHLDATALTDGPKMEATIRLREAQARAIVAFAEAHEGPLIVPGDYNTTDRNAAYATLATALRDTWREAGRGPGHTFPGGAAYALNWLVRIDYVFHSAQWRAVSARVCDWDRSSDHRPLLVQLALR